VIEVRNKLNELVAQKKVFFQRTNNKMKKEEGDISSISVENTFVAAISNKDSLKELIRSLRPIASESEKHFLDNQLKAADEKLMQRFLYNFWQSRSPLNPEEAFKRYNLDVKAVNAKFGTLVYKGYETDRGRVYLQYGPPDKREESPSEPNAYPYEIWFYYTLEDKSKLNPIQTNKRFIFYNPDLATNNYVLLHSDALGEIKESRWEMKLHKRTVQSHDFEKTDAPKHFGGNADDMFKNPR
jgi:GWxTD domain-containing protein